MKLWRLVLIPCKKFQNKDGSRGHDLAGDLFAEGVFRSAGGGASVDWRTISRVGMGYSRGADFA